MMAAFIERFGGPEVLQYGDLPDPAAGPGEVVIDVAATSVNAADWKVRLGEYKHTKFPLVPGRDFSGTVSAVGEGVKDIVMGDAVFGVCEAGQEGTYAEKVAVKAGIVAKKPSGLSHVNAAALALTGLTALSAIEDTLKLRRGETILIQGGAGGVAGFAIQLAKHIGARVITTASAANHAYVRGLGADEIVDYNVRDFAQAVANCDAVFDTVGATLRRGPSRCSNQAAARPSSLRGRRRQNHSVLTCAAEQAPDLRARPVAAPDVPWIDLHLGPRHRRPLGCLSGTKMHDADPRGRRQAAHRFGCAKRILHLAQMPNHRYIKASSPRGMHRTQRRS